MDKLISSLLCCSVDSKDDANDKAHQQSSASQKSSPNSKSYTTGANRAKSQQRSPVKDDGNATDATAAVASSPAAAHSNKKDLLDEDHSINETETITNTNDESNNTPTEPKANKELISDDDPRSTVPADSDEEEYEDDLDEDSFLDLTRLQEGQAFNPETGFLLGHKDKKYGNKKCLILDLDETLVHSSFKYLRTADFVIPVEIDNQIHHVYVIKRPGVDEFLKQVGKWFEVVVFTASVSKYGDPLLDKLDIHKSVHHRLFRDSCYNYQGNFIKNLSQIGRPLSDSIIIDNSPASYIFHPQHSIPISSWFSDTHDNELLDLLPFLEDISKENVDDVGLILDITL